MVESVIDVFWIDTMCMQDISFSLSIGNFMSFDWLLVLKICYLHSCVLLDCFISIKLRISFMLLILIHFLYIFYLKFQFY